MTVHTFDCFESIHKYAIQEFNSIRSALEEMHQAKIKVIKMCWCCGWKVKYEVEQ